MLKFKISCSQFLLVIGLSALSSPLFAVDLALPRSTDSAALSGVSSAKTVTSEHFVAGASTRSVRSPVSHSLLLNTEDKTLFKRSQSITARFAYGIAEWLDLSLGIKGTQDGRETKLDSMNYFGEVETGETTKSQKDTFAYAGSTVSVKVALVNGPYFGIALQPFVETAGAKSELSTTRSEAARAGWLGILSYDYAYHGGLAVNAGYRYRNREEFGNYILRNELIYGANAYAHLARPLALFTSFNGRQITAKDIADKRSIEDESTRSLLRGYELTGGLQMRVQDFIGTIYGGLENGKKGFDKTNPVFGIDFAYKIGDSRRSTYVDRDEEDERSDLVAAEREKKRLGEQEPIKEKKKTEKIEDDPFGLAELEKDEFLVETKDDDFSAVRAKLAKEKEQRRKNPNLSDDAVVEQELAKIRAAEAKAQAAAEQKQREEEIVRRREGLEAYNKALEDEKQYREELRDATDDIPSITTEDVSWRGLE